MKRSDFPKPFTTCLVDLNSEAAYEEQGLAARKYPRLLPIPYSAISSDEGALVLEPWRKNLKIYPQVFFLASRDIPVGDAEACDDAVLGVGLGLAISDDGILAASKNPSPRDQHICYWYSLYSDNSQVLAQEMRENICVRQLKITIESPTLGKHVFDQGDLLFDPAELLKAMNILIPYRANDLFSLGAAGTPITVPADQKFLPGEIIKVSCPELGTMEIAVDDKREPNILLNGWSPRAFFLEQE